LANAIAALSSASQKNYTTGRPQYTEILNSLNAIVKSRGEAEVVGVLQSAGTSLEKLNPLVNTPLNTVTSRAGYTVNSLNNIQLPQQKYAATMELRADIINRRNEIGSAIAQVETAIKSAKTPAALTTLNQTLTMLKGRQTDSSNLISNLETSLGIGR